jgi:hypothetical protein
VLKSASQIDKPNNQFRLYPVAHQGLVGKCHPGRVQIRLVMDTLQVEKVADKRNLQQVNLFEKRGKH